MVLRRFKGTDYTVNTLAKPKYNISIFVGSAKGDWVEAPEGGHKFLTGDGDDVILAGVSFLDLTDAPLSGGQSIVTSPIENAGNQIVDAGKGNDYVVTGSGNDDVKLGEGDDVYNSTLFGNPGAPSGNDTVSGGAGNDRIIATGSGNKTLDGGQGNDLLFIQSFGFTNFHKVDAGSGDDNIFIFSPDSNVVVDGGTGNDAIEITVKDGKISLGSGNDSGIISCGTGKVDLGGGADQIIVNFSVPNGPSTDTSNPTNAQVLGGSGDDIIGISTFQGIGQAEGGEGDDILFSINSPFASAPTGNILKGGLGKDKIFSSTGDDTIYAGAGDDTINLRGGTIELQLRSPFSNELYTRSEEVIGGGNDTVYLEGGRDTVVLGSAGRATIYGFGADDKLNVAGLGASFTRSGSDTLIQSGGNTLGVLKGYTGTTGLA